MVDEARLLIDRLQALIRETVQLAESSLNTEKNNQLRAVLQAIELLGNTGAGVPRQLVEQKEALERALSERQRAQEAATLLRVRLPELWALLPNSHKPPKRDGPNFTSSPHTPKGVLLPEEEYQKAILQVLRRMGGQGEKREVVQHVYEILHSRLGPADHGPAGPSSNEPKWKNRTAWAREHLAKTGLIRRGSPIGIWELTEAGMRND